MSVRTSMSRHTNSMCGVKVQIFKKTEKKRKDNMSVEQGIEHYRIHYTGP